MNANHTNRLRRRVVLLALLLWPLWSQATEVLTVKAQPQERRIAFDGWIEPVERATVSAQTQGRVQAIHYDINDYVPAGAVLLEISAKEQSAAVDAAEARLGRAKAVNTQAQRELRRLKTLFGTGAVASSKLDRAQAEADSALSEIEAARANLIQAREAEGYTRISAPYAGILTARHVEVGETVTPGQKLLSGYGLERMRAVTDIPQRYLSWIEPDTEFEMELPDGTRLSSREHVRFSFADPKSHSYRLRVMLDNREQRFDPGMLVKVSFAAGERNLLRVPVASLIKQHAISSVYRDIEGQWVLTQVRLGTERDGWVEVLSGLRDGDRIAGDAYALAKAVP